MRKEYTAPEAEKLEFNYSETVVASGDLREGGDPCYNDGQWGDNPACAHNNTGA